MAMGREGDRQGDLIVTWGEMPCSPGHVFYDRLQEVLIAGGFDLFVETACQPYYALKTGAPSLPPGRYFRMHMVGYFEGIGTVHSTSGGAIRVNRRSREASQHFSATSLRASALRWLDRA